MRIGMCSWSHHPEFAAGRMDLFDWMSMCASELRVHGIEITDRHLQSTDEDYLAAVKRIAVDLNLTISALTVSNDFGLETEAELTKELESMERALEVAHALGAPMLRVFAGWPVVKKETQWKEMVRCMQIACLLAERETTVLAVENHNHGGFLQTAEDVQRLMNDTDSEWLRLNLDTGNYIDGFESIEKTLIYTVHVHAKMNELDERGADRSIDYPTIIGALRERNYRGFVSLEYEGDESPLTAVPRGLAYLRQLIRD